jgi:hypothetical protein
MTVDTVDLATDQMPCHKSVASRAVNRASSGGSVGDVFDEATRSGRLTGEAIAEEPAPGGWCEVVATSLARASGETTDREALRGRPGTCARIWHSFPPRADIGRTQPDVARAAPDRIQAGQAPLRVVGRWRAQRDSNPRPSD